MTPNDRLYFRQLLAGKDFAKADPIAGQMVNFVYLIGDRQTGEAEGAGKVQVGTVRRRCYPGGKRS